MNAFRRGNLLRRLFKAGVSRGLLPFSWGGVPLHRSFRRAWRNGGPETFSEKLQYKLMHDRRPIVRTYADKLAVRGYVQGICPDVKLPRLLAQFAEERTLRNAIPPAPWVMKGSHGSAMILISERTGDVSPVEIARRAREWLRADYALRYWEWQYFRLPRRILFEEFLGANGRTPDDYKFYVMHQKVRLITVDQGRYVRHTRDAFWPDWTPVAAQIGHDPAAEVPPARPAQLGRMIEIAERLACDSDFVRVDLYCVRGEIYFGEITHAPGAGGPGFNDRAFDARLGSYWTLPPTYAEPLLPRPGSEQRSSPRRSVSAGRRQG